MALSLGRHTTRGPVGLDIDGDFVAAVQLSHGKVATAASAQLDSGIVEHGEVVDVAALTTALRGFTRDLSLPRTVRVGVSNRQIVVRHLELPWIENNDEREAAVNFQAAETIAMPLDEAVLDHHVIGERHDEDGVRRMRVIVVAARESMVRGLVEAVRAAGLRPESVDLDGFALVRALAPDTDVERAAVYCHLAAVTNLAIAAGRTCLFSRPLESRAGDSHAAAPLAEEIRLSIDSYGALPETVPVERVVLSGPRLGRNGLATELAEMLSLPVEVAPPLGRLAAHDVPSDQDPARFTVAAGLAMGAYE